jgi:hypothetical protein
MKLLLLDLRQCVDLLLRECQEDALVRHRELRGHDANAGLADAEEPADVGMQPSPSRWIAATSPTVFWSLLTTLASISALASSSVSFTPTSVVGCRFGIVGGGVAPGAGSIFSAGAVGAVGDGLVCANALEAAKSAAMAAAAAGMRLVMT